MRIDKYSIRRRKNAIKNKKYTLIDIVIFLLAIETKSYYDNNQQ
jgi:hypothetical protein